MAQKRWEYLSRRSNRYIVGLYHGIDSGNLLVYVNSEPIAIDFNVDVDKAINFNIDDEFLQIRIEKEGADYQYHFEKLSTQSPSFFQKLALRLKEWIKT